MNLSCLLILLFLLCLPNAALAGWGEDALQRESNYIYASSYTALAWNHAGVTSNLAGYGALNDIRIAHSGPDWVRPSESAHAAIGP